MEHSCLFCNYPRHFLHIFWPSFFLFTNDIDADQLPPKNPGEQPLHPFHFHMIAPNITPVGGNPPISSALVVSHSVFVLKAPCTGWGAHVLRDDSFLSIVTLTPSLSPFYTLTKKNFTDFIRALQVAEDLRLQEGGPWRSYEVQ